MVASASLRVVLLPAVRGSMWGAAEEERPVLWFSDPGDRVESSLA